MSRRSRRLIESRGVLGMIGAGSLCLAAVAGCGDRGGAEVKVGDGIEVRAPGVDVDVSQEGVNVKAPGVDVDIGDK